MKQKLPLYIFAFLFVNALPAIATPEFAAWTDNKCSKCHVNTQGGDMRNEFGWKFAKDASYFNSEDEEVKPFYDAFDKDKYAYFGKTTAFGFDFRMQTTRSHKSADAVRKYYPMQGTFYAGFFPAEWMTFSGKINAAKPEFFPGQQWWAAECFVNPGAGLPGLRFGKISPSFGLRDCDMTSLDRRTAMPDGTESLIPPDYSEYGAELVWDPGETLTFNLGIFKSDALNDVDVFGMSPLLHLENNPTSNIRLIAYPHKEFDDLPESYLGGSFTANGRFFYSTVFAGVSLSQDVNFYAKYSTTNIAFSRNTNNYIFGVTYMPEKGLFLGTRAEFGNTRMFITNDSIYPIAIDGGETVIHELKILDRLDFKNIQIVVNAKWFLMPYLELIPEYRYLRTEEYESTRWAIQFHAYY